MERVKLREDERVVAERVIAEEEALREHVVIYLSGAHAYGFPSPDSDLDLKAIHVARTEDLLGLATPAATFDRAEVVAGIEIDYTSNELAHALRGILEGNGNFLERILGATVLHASPIAGELRELAPRALSRRYHRHYHGFASNQRRALEKAPTAKALLYVLRTALTGIRLLERGVLETDLRLLVADEPALASETAELIAKKRAGERTALEPATVAQWSPRLDALFARLDAAREASSLPEEPAVAAELERWLVELRARRLATSPSSGTPRAPSSHRS